MEEINLKTINEDPKTNKLRYSKSLVSSLNKNNSKDLFNNNTNISNYYSPSNSVNNKNEKHLLIAHKINIKDKKNNYFKEGINEIFNDKNIFLNDKYKNNKVIIGRNKSKILKSKELSDNINNIANYKFSTYNKQRFNKSTNMKSSSTKRLKFDDLSKSFRKKNVIDKNLIKPYDLQENNNNSFYSNNGINQYDSIGKTFNMYGKRTGFFFSGVNHITDGELKIIYQKFLDIAKNNKKKEKLKSKNKEKSRIIYNNIISEKNKDINFKTISKTTIDKEMNARLYLQEKILNKLKEENKENQKLTEKIKKHISKDNNNLLMNQVDKYRVKIEKIDEENKINNDYNYYKTIQWMSSLRNYTKNIVKNKNILKNATLPAIYKNSNKSKDDIYNNYLNNLQYSFGNNSNLICDIDSSISPLHAFILSDNLKNNEKITNTHIDDNYNFNNNSISNDNSTKLIKNFSVPSLKNKKFLYQNSVGKDLNIEGIKLLDYEIEMSRKMYGKRKKIITPVYKDKDVEPKIFAKSYFLNNYNFPKTIRNTISLHFK